MRRCPSTEIRLTPEKIINKLASTFTSTPTCWAFVVAASLAVSSCGNDQDSSTQVADPLTAQAATQADNSKIPKNPSKSSSTDLATSLIDLATAYSSLATAVPAVPVCPWLSDASAQAAVRATVAGKPLQRRRVTEQECEWSINAGFALKIQRTPLPESGELSDVRYNMDVSPVLEPLDEPGTNAAILKDPTWDASHPRPFGIGFDLQQERILVTVIGMQTSTDQLRQVANEIAANPAGPGPATAVAPSNEPTLNPCVFDPVALATLFGGNGRETLRSKPDVSGSICEYKGSLRGGLYRLTIGLQFSGDPLTDQAGRRSNYEPANDLGDNVFTINRDELEGPNNSSRGYRIGRPNGRIDMNIMISDPAFPEASAKALINNLIARTDNSG